MDVGERVQRFQVLAQLGSGGMGTVFRARDPQLERDVAIKLMTQPTGMPALLSEHETVDLRTDAPASADDLLREARMMARLSHPNVLPVYEVGLVDGAVFVVMEHIDGCDLREWLAVPRTNAEIIDVFAQAAHGLASAHDNGIVHRDFKPDNVLIGHDGRVRVADFGLSRLVVRPHHAMRRLDDEAQGTPRYMAPELWRGDPATRQSDVYAFCVTLAEAFGAELGIALEDNLRERDVRPELRQIIMRGAVDDPAFRPTLPQILAALQPRPRARARWLAAGALAAFAGTGAVAFALISDPAPTCESSPVTSWDAPRRALVQGLLQANPQAAASTDSILGAIDDSQGQIDERWQRTCSSLAKQTLTAAQVRAQQSCLERRQFELDSRIEMFLTRPNVSLVYLFDRAQVSAIADCDDTTAPPLTGDREAVRSLYSRVMRDVEKRNNADALLAFAREAAALGERELEARTMFGAAERVAEADRLTDADALMQHAYGIALELRAIDMQARFLIRRGRNSGRLGDARAATSLAKLALDLVENQATSESTRARVYSALAHTAYERGEYQKALEYVTKGLDAIKKAGSRLPGVELNLRQDRFEALKFLERGEEALVVARENVEWARTTSGEASAEYATSLNLLAFSLLERGEKAAALDYATKAMTVAVNAMPPNSSGLVAHRLDYATILQSNEKYEDALREVQAVIAAAEQNEAVRKLQLTLATFRLGKILCSLGRLEEGVQHLERSVELGTAQYGADHRYTQAYRQDLLTAQVDLDRFDEADRTYAALERNYLTRPEENRRALVILHGMSGVTIALNHKQPREAELIGRKALAAWDELKGEAHIRAAIIAGMGNSLRQQKRWAAAIPELEKAIELAKGNGYLSPMFVAKLELWLGLCEQALHHPKAAVEHAKRAQAIFATQPYIPDSFKRDVANILR